MYLCRQKLRAMKDHDLLKPVPQGSDGAQAEENRRIAEVADELRRGCQIHEGELRDGKGDVNVLDVEHRCAERYAKDNGCWLPIERVNELGEPAYSLYGFTGFGGRSVMPILQQRLIKNARPATQVMIDTYMAALGFTKTDRKGHFTNGVYEAWDLLPRNVLVDQEGDLYVVDAEIKRL